MEVNQEHPVVFSIFWDGQSYRCEPTSVDASPEEAGLVGIFIDQREANRAQEEQYEVTLRTCSDLVYRVFKAIGTIQDDQGEPEHQHDYSGDGGKCACGDSPYLGTRSTPDIRTCPPAGSGLGTDPVPEPEPSSPSQPVPHHPFNESANFNGLCGDCGKSKRSFWHIVPTSPYPGV